MDEPTTTNETQTPVLTFEGKRYDLNALPDDLKELVRGMQVAMPSYASMKTPSRFSLLVVSPWPCN